MRWYQNFTVLLIEVDCIRILCFFYYKNDTLACTRSLENLGSADWTCPPLTGSQGLLLLHEQLCFFRSDFFMTWGDAESYCRKHGGILAKERSRKTNLFFKRQLLANFNKPKTIPCFWIGLNDKGDAGNWRWSDGKVDKHPYFIHRQFSFFADFCHHYLVQICVQRSDSNSYMQVKTFNLKEEKT